MKSSVLTTRVEGLRDLERSLAELDKTSTQKAAARNALKKAAEPFLERAAELAPDNPDTSGDDLRHSLATGTRLTTRQRRLARRSRDRSTVQVYAGATEQVNAYAHLQEFGTTHHRAQPFMRPAWVAQKAAVLSAVTRELADQIKRAAARAARRAARLAK